MVHASRPYNVISVPVFGTLKDTAIGTITIGIRFGDEAVDELKSLARTEVLLATQRTLLASTLPINRAEELLDFLTQKTGQSLDEVHPIELDKENFHYLAGKVGENSTHTINYVLLSSYQDRLEALSETRTVLLGLSSIGIGVSITVIWILIRNITRPLRLLRDGAEAVGQGDFSRRVEVLSNDECGELADAFNQMTSNLQTSRSELEKTVVELQSTQDQLLQREARLRESEEGLRLIIEGARDHVIFTIDDQQTVSRWNTAADRILGYTVSEAQGMPYSNVFDPEDYAKNRHTEILDTARSEGRIEFEGWRRRKDGTRFWADVTISRLEKLVGSEGGGFVEIARDITARKEAEEAMRKARDAAEASDRAKSEFLANMSHEVRTPMNGIIGMTGLLSDQDLNAEQSDCIDTIRASADSLLTIIDDILDISKIESGQFEISNGPVDLTSLVKETAQFFAPHCEKKKIELSVTIDEHVPNTIQSDSARIRQSLVNLIDNAVKFTETGNITVKMECGQETDEIRILVQDTGIGIPADKLDQLFTPFFQIESSFSRQYGGTGLGLAITRNIAKLLGGDISVTSAETRGSTFCFAIKAKTLTETIKPESALADRSKQQEQGTPSPKTAKKKTYDETFAEAHPLKILVVEDNAINLKVLTKILRKLGYQADTAENGKLGLEAAEANDYDFIFMDLQMPVMDGLESARRIFASKQVNAIFIAAFTANARQEDINACQAAGMQTFAAKPARPDKIAELLKQGFTWREQASVSEEV